MLLLGIPCREITQLEPVLHVRFRSHHVINKASDGLGLCVCVRPIAKQRDISEVFEIPEQIDAVLLQYLLFKFVCEEVLDVSVGDCSWEGVGYYFNLAHDSLSLFED